LSKDSARRSPQGRERCDDWAMKVLVVEDEDALAGSLSKGLAREGFELRSLLGEPWPNLPA